MFVRIGEKSGVPRGTSKSPVRQVVTRGAAFNAILTMTDPLSLGHTRMYSPVAISISSFANPVCRRGWWSLPLDEDLTFSTTLTPYSQKEAC